MTAQNKPIVLSLNKAIEVASDSSLDAFRYKNLYQAYYWQHVAYKANRLPSLTLNTNPIQFYRDITKRYDYDQNIDVYREQQTI
ncbi:MAG: TolC family protein, partial [Bacteroidales bacterium]